VFNRQKFHTPQARGIFEGDGNAYAVWKAWADELTLALDSADAHAPLSRETLDQEIVRIALQNPESAVHVVTRHMLRNASWQQLLLLRALTDWRIHPNDAGKFYRQIADWLEWYDPPAPG